MRGAATVRPVTPQHKGIIPEQAAARILAAMQGKADADTELRAAVADALKAGGSVREVMRLTGLSNDTVQRWGREGGWPTTAQKAAREETRARNAAYRQAIADAQAALDQRKRTD
jgi:DNA invertase Pin-like site-specific DNA recombinase